MNIARLRLRSADPPAMRQFYRRAFDAREVEGGCVLGAERIEITAAGDPAPDLFAGNETGFQHFAIVVADMQRGYARLCARPGWRPISVAGPERLPAASGGASAFKFRDPEGHPLELLQFAPGAIPAIWRARFDADAQRVFHGIDHTGVTVSDATLSEAFWASAGFVTTHRQVNRGDEQARLDGLVDATGAQVEIVSLSPSSGLRPGVELLCYRRPPTLIRAAADASLAATAIVLSGAQTTGERDPDGHRLLFEDAG